MIYKNRINKGLNVSRLQEVELPLGGEYEDPRSRKMKPFHFREQSETLQPPKPPSQGVADLGAGRVATRHPGLRPLFMGRWTGTSRGRPSGKQTKKQTKTLFCYSFIIYLS